MSHYLAWAPLTQIGKTFRSTLPNKGNRRASQRSFPQTCLLRQGTKPLLPGTFFIWLDINGHLSRSGKNPLYQTCSTPVQLMLRSMQASKCHLPILRPNARLEGVSQGSTRRIREQAHVTGCTVTPQTCRSSEWRPFWPPNHTESALHTQLSVAYTTGYLRLLPGAHTALRIVKVLFHTAGP